MIFCKLKNQETPPLGNEIPLLFWHQGNILKISMTKVKSHIAMLTELLNQLREWLGGIASSQFMCFVGFLNMSDNLE